METVADVASGCFFVMQNTARGSDVYPSHMPSKGDILSLFAGTLPFPMVEREKSHEATAQPAQPAPQASSMHHAHSHASSIHTRIIHLRLPVHTMPAMLP